MPEEYKDFRRVIFCNDCEKFNEVNYHFAYNKVYYLEEIKNSALIVSRIIQRW